MEKLTSAYNLLTAEGARILHFGSQLKHVDRSDSYRKRPDNFPTNISLQSLSITEFATAEEEKALHLISSEAKS